MRLFHDFFGATSRSSGVWAWRNEGRIDWRWSRGRCRSRSSRTFRRRSGRAGRMTCWAMRRTWSECRRTRRRVDRRTPRSHCPSLVQRRAVCHCQLGSDCAPSKYRRQSDVPCLPQPCPDSPPDNQPTHRSMNTVCDRKKTPSNK